MSIAATETESPPSGALLSPAWDFLMIGGLSLILFPLFLFFVPRNQDLHSIALITFYLSFAVNYPHFLISYQFLYADNLSSITTHWRLALAGIVFPVAFLIYVGYSLLVGPSSPAALSYLVNLMFFFVGHHYVKQIIGCVVVISTLNKVFFDRKERMILSINMLAIWMISYFNGNIGTRTLQMHSISYQTFNFPTVSLTTCYVVIALSLLVMAWQIVQKYIQTGKWIPANALVALASIYLWHLPVLYHPSFFYMIPLFHSLQYMLFAGAYVKNRYRPVNISPSTPQYRQQWLQGVSVYIGISIVLGTLFFYTIPHFLDKNVAYNKALYGPELFMFLFVIFINIHHYFIDFAIWRRDNENVKRYLFT